MVDRITNQVQQRIRNFFQYGFIKFGVVAADNELDVFATLSGGRANGPAQSWHDRSQRNHSNLHQSVLGVTRQTLPATK